MRVRHGLRTESVRRHSAQRSIGVPALLTVLTVVAVAAGLVILFPMDWIKAPSVSVSVEQEAFSPNQDGDQDTAVVLYALSGNSGVSAHVLDETQSVVRTLTAEDARNAGQHSLVWDGRDDHGKTVADGQYYVRLTAKGSARRASNSAPVLVDTVPPVIRLANMPQDIQVKEETLRIEGVTEPDSTLWLNDSPQPVQVDGSGGFSINYRLREGQNRIELSAVDGAGNRASVVRQVNLLLKPPDIVVDNPPNDLWINQKLLSVQGRVPAGTLLTVNGREAAVDAGGQYNLDVLLQEGENTLFFKASDAVGNEATTERRVFLKTRPPALALTSVKEGMEVDEPSLLVTGQTEVGASVRLNGRDLVVDSRGGFQGLVNLVQGDNLVKAEAVDRAGNVATLSRRVTYGQPTSSQSLPNLRAALPALVIGAGTLLAFWLLLGGWLSPIAISFSADRTLMRPDPQGNVEPVLFSLELSRSAKVTVDVWNGSDELVATLIYRRKRGSGEHILVWDGRNDEGHPVPHGVYEIEATASTLTTSVSSSVRLQVDTVTSLVSARRFTGDGIAASFR